MQVPVMPPSSVLLQLHVVTPACNRRPLSALSNGTLLVRICAGNSGGDAIQVKIAHSLGVPLQDLSSLVLRDASFGIVSITDVAVAVAGILGTAAAAPAAATAAAPTATASAASRPLAPAGNDVGDIGPAEADWSHGAGVGGDVRAQRPAHTPANGGDRAAVDGRRRGGRDSGRGGSIGWSGFSVHGDGIGADAVSTAAGSGLRSVGLENVSLDASCPVFPDASCPGSDTLHASSSCGSATRKAMLTPGAYSDTISGGKGGGSGGFTACKPISAASGRVFTDPTVVRKSVDVASLFSSSLGRDVGGSGGGGIGGGFESRSNRCSRNLSVAAAESSGDVAVFGGFVGGLHDSSGMVLPGIMWGGHSPTLSLMLEVCDWRMLRDPDMRREVWRCLRCPCASCDATRRRSPTPRPFISLKPGSLVAGIRVASLLTAGAAACMMGPTGVLVVAGCLYLSQQSLD